MSAQGAVPPQLQGRVAGGFDWLSSMDGLYGKSDSLWEKAQFSSGDAGRNQRVFGEVMWQQANTNTPFFGMMPKMPAESAPSNIADPRPMTYRAVFNPPTFSAVDEGGAWDTPVDFDTREVELDPRHSTMRFEGTVLQQVLADIQDGVPFDNITQIGEEYFQRSLEADGIARAVESSTDAGTQYADSDKITSIDRVVASEDEEANATDVNGTAFNNGDLDVYNIDRSATGADASNEANWADAVVNHNSGTDRQLTKDALNETIESLEQNGTNRGNLTIFTGYDTARVISELTESQFRADAMDQLMSQTVNRGTDSGTETRRGHSWGTQLSTYEGIPIVPGPNVPSDGLSRVYMLDMTTQQDPVTGQNIPKLGVETYIPMTVETAGLGQSTNTLALDNLVEQQGLLTTHQIRCNRFNHQGKLRDLKE